MDQPHILVTGDAWQYVPFGRARLKSLRATGLSYASQSYTVDGTTIKVRIVGDQSFIQIDGEQTLYCESGQLFWPFRPKFSPLWGEAATWAFMDIPTTSKYLGKIKAGKEVRGDQGNTPKLSEGMRSKAIGWPLADLGSVPANETKDKETQEKYFTHTITKKRAMGILPASIFSGKMRLFMQSLYGAKEPNPDNPGDYFPFLLDNEDEPSLVMLRSSLEGGSMLMIRSDSMGVFTAPDNTYWLLDINEGPRNVLVNRINTSKATSLVKQLKDMNADERAKAEAYIFANSKIEIPKPENTVYATGTFPEVIGSAMAYGWKWNTDGSKASIVVHEQLGETIPETRWHSRTVHLTFSYTAAQGDTPARISVAGVVEDSNDWIDGWGATNLFVPEAPNKYSPLLLHSLRAGSGLIPPVIPFSDTPIYGYYVNDAWTPVILSNNGVASTVTNSSASGVVYPYGAGPPEHSAQPWVGAAVDGWRPHSYTFLTKIISPGFKISFDGFSYEAESNVLNGQTISQSWTPTDDNIPSSVGYWAGTHIDSDGGSGLPSSTDFTTIKGSAPPYELYARPLWGEMVTVGVTTTGDEGKTFAAVIPGGDAEAFYVATYRGRTAGDVVTTTTSYQGGGWGVVFYIDQTPPAHTVEVGRGAGWQSHLWTQIAPGQRDSWNDGQGAGTQYGPYTTQTTETLEREVEVKIRCFNSKVHGLVGEPGGGYNGLFDVNYQYPQYDRGMYTYTSYGGRYIMSEAPSNPTSITWHNFVGWA